MNLSLGCIRFHFWFTNLGSQLWPHEFAIQNSMNYLTVQMHCDWSKNSKYRSCRPSSFYDVMQSTMSDTISAVRLTHLNLTGRGGRCTYGVFDPKLWIADNLTVFLDNASFGGAVPLPLAANLTRLKVKTSYWVDDISGLSELKHLQKLKIGLVLDSEQYLLRSLAQLTRCSFFSDLQYSRIYRNNLLKVQCH